MADVTVDLQALVLAPTIGYSVVDTERIRMETFAGLRYLYIDQNLDLKLFGVNIDNKSDSGSLWDGIVGVRGDVNLNKEWFLPYYLDVGVGDSTFTWQAIGGVGYRINKNVDVAATYRYLEWKFKNNKVLDNLDMSGPLVGLRFMF
jgi:opacity protein-like surface antigen